MAITAEQFADSLNKAGIDTPAKADKFVQIAARQVSRVGKQLALADLDRAQTAAVQSIEQQRQALTAAIQADTDAIVAALQP